MKRIHRFITSRRDGCITIEYLADKIIVDLDCSGGSIIEGSEDMQELHDVFEPLMASIRDDPRPAYFNDGRSRQQVLHGRNIHQ